MDVHLFISKKYFLCVSAGHLFVICKLKCRLFDEAITLRHDACAFFLAILEIYKGGRDFKDGAECMRV